MKHYTYCFLCFSVTQIIQFTHFHKKLIIYFNILFNKIENCFNLQEYRILDDLASQFSFIKRIVLLPDRENVHLYCWCFQPFPDSTGNIGLLYIYEIMFLIERIRCSICEVCYSSEWLYETITFFLFSYTQLNND